MSEPSPITQFSWEQPGQAAASQALTVRKREHEQLVRQFHHRKREQQQQLDGYQKQLDEKKQSILHERAENRIRTNGLRSQRAKLDDERAFVRREREDVQLEMNTLQAREEESKRNRTTSMIFIEDRFATLVAKEVLEYLTHSSQRIREHTMNNVLFCICGAGESEPSFVKFNAADTAPFILPKFDQLLSTRHPSDRVQSFALQVVKAPKMGKALALNGQCSKIAELMIRNNKSVNELAIAAFTTMMQLDTQVITAVYTALQAIISQIPLSDSASSPAHPAEVYLANLTPNIIRNCYNNGRWSLVDPLVSHKSDLIRQAALDQIVIEATKEDRVRQGLLEVKTIRLLEPLYESAHPPEDVIVFFTKLLPLLSTTMCRQIDDVHWLISRLNDPASQISSTVMTQFRVASATEDPVVLHAFTDTELLRRLQEATAQDTAAVTSLIGCLLPRLALPHARSRYCSRILSFLDHADHDITVACLNACDKILSSSLENRAGLYAEMARLNYSKESTLALCERAMPILCEDWIAATDFAKVLKFALHPQERVRRPVHEVWRKVVSTSTAAGAKVVLDGHLSAIFELCSSEYEDCISLGAFSLQHMAGEIAKAGPEPTRQLIRLLDRPQDHLRLAVLQSLQTIAEGGPSHCETLLKAEILDSLKLSLQRYPQSAYDTHMGVTRKTLRHLAPYFSKSNEACCGLLQLLNCNIPELTRAVRPALDWIAVTNIEDRAILRSAILDNLQFGSDSVVEYSEKAIRDWIGPDLVQIGQPQVLFQLASNPDPRIRNSALISLKQSVQNEDCHSSLEREGFVPLLHSLLDSGTPEATDLVATALRSLCLTLTRTGHVDEIFSYLSHESTIIRSAACTAIEAVASGSTEDRQQLLNEGVLERLIHSSEHLGPSELRLASAIIPKFAPEYVRMRKIKFILGLVDHNQEPIQMAAVSAVEAIAGGNEYERTALKDTLMPLLGGASVTLRGVAAKCLAQTLARHLLVEGEYKQAFSLLHHEDSQIGEAIVAALQFHIQSSGATIRKKVVDAGILNALLQALSKSAQAGLVSFTVDCVLPTLGPFFTQNDGGASLTPLLRHQDPRIRTSAIIAIKNAVDSRHGNLENIANANIMSHLHSFMEDDKIRDLLCHLVPKIAPFITSSREIDILFEDLNDPRAPVRQAAATGINLMAKTSDRSRFNLYLALKNQLDGPPAAAVESIANALSLLGSMFVLNGNERTLLEVIEHGELALAGAAAEAIIQVLEKGSMIDRQKLMDAGVFEVALSVHGADLDERITSRLLNSVIRTLNHLIIRDEASFERLLLIFDDPDPSLSKTLCQSLIDLAPASRLTDRIRLNQMYPLLLDKARQRKPDVVRLLKELAPYVMQKLLHYQMVPIISRLLKAENDEVVKSYLDVLQIELEEANEFEKDLLISESEFLSALLQDRNITMHRISSAIVKSLSQRSAQRSAKLMEQGVGSWLLNGKYDVNASLAAARILYLTAPDHADQLVEDSLPTILSSLENLVATLEEHRSSLRFLNDIVKRTPHDIIILSGAIETLVAWLNPQFSVVDTECRRHVYEVCQLISQRSDAGRQTFIEQNALPILIQLSASHVVDEVVWACNILKALAHSGRFRSQLLEAGVKNAMERIMSPIRKSTLNHKHEKAQAQRAAKEVLSVLQSTKQAVLLVEPMNNDIQRRDSTMRVDPRMAGFSLNSRGQRGTYQAGVSDVDLGGYEYQDNIRRNMPEQTDRQPVSPVQRNSAYSSAQPMAQVDPRINSSFLNLRGRRMTHQAAASDIGPHADGSQDSLRRNRTDQFNEPMARPQFVEPSTQRNSMMSTTTSTTRLEPRIANSHLRGRRSVYQENTSDVDVTGNERQDNLRRSIHETFNERGMPEEDYQSLDNISAPPRPAMRAQFGGRDMFQDDQRQDLYGVQQGTHHGSEEQTVPPSYRTYTADTSTVTGANTGRMRRFASEDGGIQRSGTRNTFGRRPPPVHGWVD